MRKMSVENLFNDLFSKSLKGTGHFFIGLCAEQGEGEAAAGSEHQDHQGPA